MKEFPTRNRSWCVKNLNCQLDPEFISEEQEQVPVKYYIAEQMLKAASRQEDYIKNELELMNHQNTLLQQIKDYIYNREMSTSPYVAVNILDESIMFEKSFSNKQGINTIKRQNQLCQPLNTTINTRRSSKINRGEEILLRIERTLGRDDYEYILGLINQNKAFKRDIDEQQRFKPMFEAQKKNNEVLRLQILKYQGKIGQIDKQLCKANETIKQYKKEKENYNGSLVQIQSQIKLNTSNSTNLMINQKILKNQRKRLELEKQMLQKIKRELDQQAQQIQEAWKKYLPGELVREGREHIKKYTSLLKQQYSKIKGLNQQIQSFNSKLTIL